MAELLNEGMPKHEVFKQLSGGEVKDSQLAIFIASHPDPMLYEKYDKKVDRLITVMFIQALLAGALGLVIGHKIGAITSLVLAAVFAMIPLAFAYGFYKNHAATFNAYLILTVIQLPNTFKGFLQSPIASTVGMAIGAAIFAYVWHVRSLLFPDFAFITPRKKNGQYLFDGQIATTMERPKEKPAARNKSTPSMAEAATESMSWGRLITLTAFGVLLFIAGFSMYLRLPNLMQIGLTSFFERPFAPNFDLPPNQIGVVRQDDWISEYKRRGYNMHCYAALYPEDKVSKDDDYVCWAVVKSAYDNIPAKIVTFWFRKGELQHLKIDFPDSSFAQLQEFLGKHFKGMKRLDEMPGFSFDTDIYGNSLMVWPAKHGIVVTSSAPTTERPLVLLWSSKESYVRNALSTLMPKGIEGVSAASNTTKPDPADTLPKAHSTDQGKIDETKPSPMPPGLKMNSPRDISHCLDLESDEAIAKCASKS